MLACGKGADGWGAIASRRDPYGAFIADYWPSTRAAKLKSYQFSQLKYDHHDIRFTTKGEVLYAIALGWPQDGKFVITSLADNSADYPGRIGKVELLGHESKLKWTRGPGGLQTEVPAAPQGRYAYSFRIQPA
jgi:alpha-L-fucosidase